MSHSHFELDENFNFVEEGEEVTNEEIVAPEFDPSNIFIVPPERSPPTSQASQSGSTSSTVGPNTTSKRQRTSMFGHVLLWKNVKKKKVKWWIKQCANIVNLL